MRKPREVLESIEAALEGGKEPTQVPFVELGMPATLDPIESEPRPGWDAGEVALFHYVRGTLCLARATNVANDAGAHAFVDAFVGLVAAKDAARATRAVARALRLWARSSMAVSVVLDAASMMFEQLAWMRANAPRRDVEELELSLVEMLTGMVRTAGAPPGDAVARVFALTRPTLSRLFEQLLTRQRSVPYGIAAYWLAFPELWAESDLDAPREWFGAIGGGRAELRRAALAKACELEDGSTYRVGWALPVSERKRASLEQLQRELEVARAEAERGHGDARRGADTKPHAARGGAPGAMTKADATKANAEPMTSEPAHAVEPVAASVEAGTPVTAVEPVTPVISVDPVVSIELAAIEPAPLDEVPALKKAAKKPAAKKAASKDAGAQAKPAKKSGTKTKR